MKIVCMIPARMGSKRVPRKNLRLLGGVPLIYHVIRAAKEADCFSEIYVNTESDVLGQRAINEGVRYYHRPYRLASDTATNDDFVEDFLNNIGCDVVVQLLPTSPFITAKEIREFVSEMKDESLHTLVSVRDNQIECIYNNKPINFDLKLPTPPSQELEPIKSYACVLMGWRKNLYLHNMSRYGCAYHGGDGKTRYFTLKGFSEIDIDSEEDFTMAEAIWSYLNES